MRVILLLLSLWLLPSLAEAACSGSSPTLTAASAAYTDVNDCVTAAVTGDTVIVPAGTASWATRLSISNKSIILQGAGAGTQAQCAVGGQTTYTCITMDSTLTTGLVFWTHIATGSPRLTAMTFDGGPTGSSCAATAGLLFFNGITDSFRMDHVTIISRRCHGLISKGSILGVFDHGTSINASGNFSMYLHTPNYLTGTSTCANYSGGCGDQAWANPSDFGTSKFLFVEDWTFTRESGAAQYCIDGWIGQRTVVRFSTINDCVIGGHGTDTSGRTRGERAKEYYRNQFNATAINISSATHSRGGTGRFFDNAVTESGGNFTRLYDMSHYRTIAGNEIALWGACDDNTTITSSTSSSDWHTGQGGLGSAPRNSFDQGAGTTDGYACMDQIGRGEGDAISGDEFGGAGILPVGWPNQVLDPIYTWNNDIDGVNSPAVVNAGGDYVQENRDFYTERSGFDGTASVVTGGVGVGLRSARPATCTAGVAYWSTDGGGNWNTSGDDGGLDLCTATNTWTNDSYVPYTYPHPLIAGEAATVNYRTSGGSRLSGGARMP